MTGAGVRLTNMFSRVKAANRLGESSWSDYATITTLIDTDQIPRVRSLSYHNTSNTLTFTTQPYPLPLLAKIETRPEAGSWRLVKTANLKKEPFVFLLPRDLSVSGLRVRLCLQSEPRPVRTVQAGGRGRHREGGRPSAQHRRD